MAIEIERKFLVVGDAWRQGLPKKLSQGYLNTDKSKTVRIRISDTEAFLTVKGKTLGLSRSEFEYRIPVADAEQMLALCGNASLEKHRYCIEVGELTWEVDEFFGANDGLIVAEVELNDENQVIDLPNWIGTEVSGDARYYNSALVTNPYTLWPD